MSAKLYCIGLGPGGPDHCTPAATKAIESSDVIVGYKTYIDLIPHLLTGKQVLSSGMKREIDRCREAIEEAAKGRSVALISSGDSGIYGMAGLVLELLEGRDIAVEVVPGVSAVQAAASRLGAPLMHDFAVISLSDLMTPWSLIRSRLDAAGRADFVVALYNPRSKGRTTQIGEAQEILLRHRASETPVGIVRNACREGESIIYTTLGRMAIEEIDMLSLVMIGNSCTRMEAGRMLTPRGYSEKYLKPKEDAEGKPARALFVGGTGSDVGKSLMTAGLCRLLRRRGFDVAPFKAQNMALNSAVTPEGGEIGRAQALQAAACGLAPHTDMNPVLLKPNSETGSQVIVQGRVVANMDVRRYHAYKEEAFSRVRESFGRLSEKHELVVMEGAGSIAEVNLREQDITNLRAAAMAEAPVILVADIDRGGVFAQVVGTMELLRPEERSQVKGIVINKFRGEKALLDSGIALIEDRCGVPVLGVVPWLKLALPEEDSLALERKPRAGGKSPSLLNVGVLRLPRISNYGDFDPLERFPGVGLAYLREPKELEDLDLLILPGSKSTISDLDWMNRSGFSDAIRAFHDRGGRILGICGGYQMLGRSIRDPFAMESDIRELEGLGLLDVETSLEQTKQTHPVRIEVLGAARRAGLSCGPQAEGYEIHLGISRPGPEAAPLFRLSRSSSGETVEDGALSADGRVWGSYIHGLFEDEALCRSVLAPLFEEKGLALPEPAERPGPETELDRLADHLEAHLNLDPILQLIQAESRP